MARQASSRVSKRSSSRGSRVRSRMSTVGGSANGGVLERMVEEAAAAADPQAPARAVEGSEGNVAQQNEDVYMASQDTNNVYEGKGKGKVAAVPATNEDDTKTGEDKPFRLFDLPTEIRLEIYRACLTRPYKILLSKPGKTKPQVEDKEDEDDDAVEGVVDDESLAAGAVQAAGLAERRGWPTTSSQGRAAQQSPRRRDGGRGSAWPKLLRASTSATRPQSQASTSTGSSTISDRLTSVFAPNPTSNNSFRRSTSTAKKTRATAEKDSNSHKMDDPLLVTILRTNKDVYKEARDVLYSENVFSLDIFTAVTSLAALHQRSRRRIKYVELEIPTYTDILEAFSDAVRLSLRYCSGLRKLVIHTPFHLPGSDAATATSGSATGNTTVYANGFDILRWLPQGCEVVLEGTKNKDIDAVVGRHMRLASVQDKLAYARRQIISNDADSTT